MDFIRPDFIITYWTFTWFLIYYFVPLSPYFKKYANPLLVLYIELIENIGNLLYIVFYPRSLHWTVLFTYCIMMLLLKIIPIYLLSDHTILWKHDILVFVVFFTVYNLYLFLHGTNMIQVYRQISQSILAGNNKAPMFYLISKISKIFQ
jgi:hypothetical protein